MAGIFQRATSGIRAWLDSINPYRPDRLSKDGLKPVALEESALKKRVTQFIVAFFLVFSVWAVTAPIDGGVVVPGTVAVEGNRKAVQHPGGGVVEKILVKEGARVRQGDVLITLNPLSIEANLSSTELEYINAITNYSRLLSERLHKPSIEWLPQIKAYEGDPRLVAAVRLQTEVFKSRTAELEGQKKILAEQIAGLEAQLQGMGVTLKEREHQIKLVTEEAKDMATLAAEGFVPRNQAYQSERSRSELMAGIATTQADQARAISTLAGTKLQMIQLMSTYHKDLDTQISDIQKVQQALAAKVEALRFERSLIEIRAPVSGTVVGLKVFTLGGVITAGNVLMEILPEDQHLLVDAQIPPMYIDKVKLGSEADMRFTSFNVTTTPVIPGKVVLVGADKLTSTSQSTSAIVATGQSSDYYLARIETTPEGQKRLGALRVQPGMIVDVIIKTGERSLFSYVIKPITDRFATAFKGE